MGFHQRNGVCEASVYFREGESMLAAILDVLRVASSPS